MRACPFAFSPTVENGVFTCQADKVATKIAGCMGYRLTIDLLRILKQPFSVT
jgi:hypothetical protein